MSLQTSEISVSSLAIQSSFFPGKKTCTNFLDKRSFRDIFLCGDLISVKNIASESCVLKYGIFIEMHAKQRRIHQLIYADYVFHDFGFFKIL